MERTIKTNGSNRDMFTSSLWGGGKKTERKKKQRERKGWLAG